MAEFFAETFFDQQKHLQYHVKRVTKHSTDYFQLHWHTYYEIIYCELGELDVVGLDKTIRLQKNDALLLPSNYIHDTKIVKGSFRIIVFQFSTVFLNSFLKSNYATMLTQKFDTDTISPYHDKTKEIHFLFSRMFSETKEQIAISKIQGLLLTILSTLSKSTSTEINSLNKIPENFNLEEIKSYLRSHLTGDLSLSNVAKKFHFSPSYFSKQFKKYSGISFNDYVNAIKIERAQFFLFAKNMQVQEVAQTLGYKDPQNFSRLYKQKTGFSPSEHRKISTPPPENR